VDTLGPLPEDENGNKHVILIVDDFSKFVGLYPSRSTTSDEFATMGVRIWGAQANPDRWRDPVQFQAHSGSTNNLLNFEQLTVVAYHPQANGLAERRMKEVMKHLRAQVYEKRIKEIWSQYLPLVQRIINYSVDGSIGTMPACYLGGFGRFRFGNGFTSGLGRSI
jgi:hypothetical protein